MITRGGKKIRLCDNYESKSDKISKGKVREAGSFESFLCQITFL